LSIVLSIILPNLSEVVDASDVQTKTIQFGESTSRSQTQSTTITNLTQVLSVSVDNGNVSYSVSGDRITFNLSNGTGYQVQTGGSYTPPDSKTVTATRSTSPGGNPDSLPSSISYNSGGYSGTLTKTGSATVTSGSYIAPSSKSVTVSRSISYDSAWMCVSPSGVYNFWNASPTKSSDSSYNYNSGGYTGTLPLDTNSVSPAPNTKKPTGSCTPGQPKTVTYTASVKYSGTVTKPAVDTRVWTQTYSGTVTKPAVDTRTYETRYKYKVTISYLTYNGSDLTNVKADAGIVLDGSTQYFRVSSVSRYQPSKTLSVGILFKPTSTSITSRQNLFSDTQSGGVALTLQPSGLVGYAYINGGYETVKAPISYVGMNKWNYVALTYDGSKLNLYLNGDLVSTDTITGTLSYPSNVDWLIGAEPENGYEQYFFKGQIASFQIWYRTLSATEIADASNGSYASSGLVGRWDFSSLTTGKSYDKSSYSNVATGYGFATSGSLSATGTSFYKTSISWSSNSSSTSYRLERDGVQVYSGTGTSFTDSSLEPQTGYSYSLYYVDNSGESAPISKSVTTTGGDFKIVGSPNIVFNSVTLDGKKRVLSGTIQGTIQVYDTRKVRTKWHVEASIDAVTSSNGKSLPLGSISFSPSQYSLQDGVSPSLVFSDSGIKNDGLSHTVLTKSSTDGFGIYQLTYPSNTPISLTLPASVYSGTDYHLKVTWKLVED
jgi:hypothetical protein